jgi:hypothetical protein
MKYRLKSRPEVSTDILEAADWYEHHEHQQPGLGADFAREVRENRFTDEQDQASNELAGARQLGNNTRFALTLLRWFHGNR